MTPSEAITEFFNHVSWGNECLTLTAPSDRPYLACNLYTLIPCHWSECEHKKDLAIETANRWNVKPGFILYGDCSDYDCDRLNYELGRAGFVIYWLGAKQQVKYSRFLSSSFDGVNFVKSMYPDL
jgi:hypothetical protein